MPGSASRKPSAAAGSAAVTSRRRRAWRVPVVVVAGAVPFAFLLVTRELVPALVLLAVTGSCWGPYFAVERTLVQRLTPEVARDSVMGARTAISSLGFPAGSAVAGALCASLGPVSAVAVTTAGYLLVAMMLVSATRCAEPGTILAR